MQLVSVRSLLENFGRAIKPNLNMSIYVGNYDCACGKKHSLDFMTRILCEGRMKVIVSCPEDPNYITSVKIKTFLVFKFKGFETLAKAKIQTEEDAQDLAIILSVIR